MRHTEEETSDKRSPKTSLDAFINAELMASIRRVISPKPSIHSRRGGMVIENVTTEGCGVGILITDSDNTYISGHRSIDDGVSLEIRNSTRSSVDRSTSYKGEAMSDKETKGFVIRNSADTSFSDVTSIGNDVGYEVSDSTDTSFKDASAISLEAHKISSQLQYYIVQLGNDKHLSENAELKSQLIELDSAINKEGIGSKAVKLVASNTFTLVMSAIAGYAGNNLPDILLTIRTFLTHLF